MSCVPGIEGKSLLLQMPLTSDVGPGECELDLTWKPPPWRLAALVPEGDIQATKRRKKAIILLSCEAYKPQNVQYGKCNSGIHILAVTKAV